MGLVNASAARLYQQVDCIQGNQSDTAELQNPIHSYPRNFVTDKAVKVMKARGSNCDESQ
jgi:hypothetical protein